MLNYKRLWIGLTPFVFVALLAIILLKGLWRDNAQPHMGLFGEMLPNFNLPDLLNPEIFYTKSLFSNKISLINVWATWCGPCAQEHSFLVELAQKNRIPIYGVNYHDTRNDAIKWLAEKGNPYRTVLFDPEGKTSIDWGILGVPETYLIDNRGVIRYRYRGVLTELVWKEKILPVIKLLEKEEQR